MIKIDVKRDIIKNAKNLPDLLQQLEALHADDTVKRSCIEEYLRIKAWYAGIPRFGKFELTPLCNLDCRMCYIHLQKEQLGDKGLLSVDQWKRLMQEAADAGMKVATLTGGECLTYYGFEELYLFLQSLGVEIVVFTNGILLNEEKIQFFREHPPRLIQVSLYGSTEDAYEKVTGHRVYGAVMEHIEKARAADLPITVAVTPSVYMEDAESIIRLLAGMGQPYTISAGLFEPYEATGRKGKAVELSKEKYLDLYKLQAELKGKKLTPMSEDCLPIPEKETDGGVGLLCGGGNSGFVINYQGMLYPCSMLQEYGAEPLRTGFQEAWEAVHRFVKNYPRPMECEDCKLKTVCTNCVAEHAKGAAKGHANPNVCAWGRCLLRAGFAASDENG